MRGGPPAVVAPRAGAAPVAALLVAGVGAGCQRDYRVGLQEDEKVPVAQPDTGEAGDDAPDWADCGRGWRGAYFNHRADHVDFGEESPTEPPFAPDLVDWWEPTYFSFERYDATLDIGPGFWPVDEGLEGDPAFFAVRWTAWAYVEDALPATLYLTASTDVWVRIGDQVLAQGHGDGEAVSAQVELDLPVGQSPVEVSFAHRRGDSALALRFVGEHVNLCYPDFSAE